LVVDLGKREKGILLNKEGCRFFPIKGKEKEVTFLARAGAQGNEKKKKRFILQRKKFWAEVRGKKKISGQKKTKTNCGKKKNGLCRQGKEQTLKKASLVDA